MFDVSHASRHGALRLRDGGVARERHHYRLAVRESRRWLLNEPYRTDWVLSFWSHMEREYPMWKWDRQTQTDLREYGGESA